MPARPRGRGFRGGGRGNYGGHWRGHRGGGGYHGGGRGMGHRGHGGRHDHYHGNREMHNPHQQRDPEKLLSSLGPEAQLALTTAIINSVLKTDGREGHSNYRERDYHSRHRGSHHEGRGGYFREESRERRHFGEDRRSHEPRLYHEEGRGHHYEREKPTPGSPRYRNNRYSAMPRRRPSPHGHAGPSRKRQRMERMDSMEGDSSPHHDHDYEGERKSEVDRERVRERKCRSPDQDRDHSGCEDDGKKNNEEKGTGSDDPGGVQVTIRADGERAVNNEGRGRPRVAGRLFVELRCPHCPNQRSITFKEYKYHLGSEEHKSQLNRLARKHSVVLRKIRVQQRKEQRDIEVKWKEEKEEEYKDSVTRFCNTCKLVFKCLGGNTGEGISLHNSSKLHRMQKCYLHPRCAICRITFPSRMVYEYHIASISHLRVRTATMDKQGGSHRSDDPEQEEEDDDLDLTDFMTLDSVGEDDEVGSEHEEITGGLDEAEVAKEAEGRRKQSLRRRYRSDVLDDDEISVDADWDKDQPEDEDTEENEAVGTEYVNRIEAYFCSICCKVIRADTSIGSRAVKRHCMSYDHVNHYRDSHPPVDEDIVSDDENDEDVEDGEREENLEKKGDKDKIKNKKEDEAEGDMEDAEQEKLWEEVNKGLNMLQDEIMTEIEERESVKTKKNDKEIEAVEARSSKKMDENELEVGEEEEDEEEEEEEAVAVKAAAESAEENKAGPSRHNKLRKPSSELLEEIADDSEGDT